MVSSFPLILVSGDPISPSKHSWNLDHWRKQQFPLLLLFGHPLRKYFYDSLLHASPVPSSGRRQIRQSLWLIIHPQPQELSLLPQTLRSILSKSFSIWPRLPVAPARLVPASSPFPPHHCTQLFRSCPLPGATFREEERVIVRWTADKGDWGSGGARGDAYL